MLNIDKKFPTNEFKDLALEILKDNKNKEIPLILIKYKIKEKYGLEFKHTIISSAMRDLLKENERVVNIDRGIYLYSTNLKKIKINKNIDICIDNIKEIFKDNYLELSNEEKELLRNNKNIIEKLYDLKI
ncbi:hypothetical protein [Staphylococcus phage LY01]|nr:hypothetical protein [Staphylococcus phage LY01]